MPKTLSMHKVYEGVFWLFSSVSF